VVEHPIEGLMKTAMESIKEMVDVNTIVGDAVQAPDGTVIIPISRVAFGFASGGGDYSRNGNNKKTQSDEDSEGGIQSSQYPFAGGSGAGVSISPVAFMVVGQDQIRLLPVNINSSVDKMLDMIPELFNRLNETIKKRITIKKDTRTCDKASTAAREKDDEE